jgi:hypothetical protein
MRVLGVLQGRLKKLAAEIRRDYAKIDDSARLNEIETQLRQGLSYLARRMNQGAHVEINVGVPDEPVPPKAETEGTEATEAFQQALSEAKEHIARLRDLRDRARSASAATTAIGQNAPLLLTQDDSQGSATGDQKKPDA